MTPFEPVRTRFVDYVVSRVTGLTRAGDACVVSTDDVTELTAALDELAHALEPRFSPGDLEYWSLVPTGPRWSVTDVEQVILPRLATSPARYRVLVVTGAETLTRVADRLLLPLESSPFTLWILATTDPSALSTTIRGRTGAPYVIAAPDIVPPTTSLVSTPTPGLSARAALAGVGTDQLTPHALALVAQYRRHVVSLLDTDDLALLARLITIAAALDDAQRALILGATPMFALATLYAAVGPDALPEPRLTAVERAASPIAHPSPAEPSDTFVSPDSSGDTVLVASDTEPFERWSPSPPFVPLATR